MTTACVLPFEYTCYATLPLTRTHCVHCANPSAHHSHSLLAARDAIRPFAHPSLLLTGLPPCWGYVGQRRKNMPRGKGYLCCLSPLGPGWEEEFAASVFTVSAPDAAGGVEDVGRRAGAVVKLGATVILIDQRGMVWNSKPGGSMSLTVNGWVGLRQRGARGEMHVRFTNTDDGGIGGGSESGGGGGGSGSGPGVSAAAGLSSGAAVGGGEHGEGGSVAESAHRSIVVGGSEDTLDAVLVAQRAPDSPFSRREQSDSGDGKEGSPFFADGENGSLLHQRFSADDLTALGGEGGSPAAAVSSVASTASAGNAEGQAGRQQQQQQQQEEEEELGGGSGGGEGEAVRYGQRVFIDVADSHRSRTRRNEKRLSNFKKDNSKIMGGYICCDGQGWDLMFTLVREH